MPTISWRTTVTYSQQEVIEMINEFASPSGGDHVIEDKYDSIVMTVSLPKRAFIDSAREDSNFPSDLGYIGTSLLGEVTVEPDTGDVVVTIESQSIS